MHLVYVLELYIFFEFGNISMKKIPKLAKIDFYWFFTFNYFQIGLGWSNSSVGLILLLELSKLL